MPLRFEMQQKHVRCSFKQEVAKAGESLAAGDRAAQGRDAGVNAGLSAALSAARKHSHTPQISAADRPAFTPAHAYTPSAARKH